MNLLAHLYLSGTDDQIRLGNFFADSVKGRQTDLYSPEIQQGIRLHRNIDTFTDHDNTVRKSVKILRPKYHMYSGVIIDLAYDHFLAANWQQFTDMDMDSFITKSYRLLLKNYNILPGRTRRFLPFMIFNNWLKSYKSLEGLHDSLLGLARRTKFDSGMEYAIKDVKLHYDELNEDFLDFFPRIIEFVKTDPVVRWYDQE